MSRRFFESELVEKNKFAAEYMNKTTAAKTILDIRSFNP